MAAWKPHFYRVGPTTKEFDEPPEETGEHRKSIEPWLSAVFQSEHLSLLAGSGLPNGVAAIAGTKTLTMAKAAFNCQLEDKVNEFAESSAKECGRTPANIEDQLRAAMSLISGLTVMSDPRAKQWESSLNTVLTAFLGSILDCERELRTVFDGGQEKGRLAKQALVSFLLSFASRTASRERLNVFTTNYDRLIEYGCDVIGLRAVDRFVGALNPVFRSSRLDVDLHYNPPGIRGEPRFLEGVIKLTKLHGSIDWQIRGGVLTRVGIGFGADPGHPDLPSKPLNSVMIYPNPAKDIETSEYPYAELFRDFSAALCRPNSALVTYGYGFGDDHINRVICDALTIPSTHLVIISFDQASGRIPEFCGRVGRKAQISLLIGSHFGDLGTLIENYLPKPAIDQITGRKTDLLKRRGELLAAGMPDKGSEGES
jgi:hypothetical protein